MFQLANVRKHHKSTQHIKAVAEYFGVPYPEYRAYVDHCEEHETLNVPRTIKFAWAIHVCHAGESHSSFPSFLRFNDIPKENCRNVLTDESRKAVAKMQHCVSYADREINDFPVLENCVRLAQACDDRDQCLSLRYRAVTLFPVTKIHDRFGGLLRDYGFSQLDICEAIKRLWKYIMFLL